jgi:hypothetical protein
MAWHGIAVQFPNDVSSYCTSEDRFVPENMDAEEKKDSLEKAKLVDSGHHFFLLFLSIKGSIVDIPFNTINLLCKQVCPLTST